MKALFFLLDGETNASSRQRVLQYVPFLRAHGIEPVISRPVPERWYQQLVECGQGGTKSKAMFYGMFLARRTTDVLRSGSADVVVIQRDLFPFGPPVLERMLRTRNPHIVYDTDDATYLRPSFTPRTPFQQLRAWRKPAEVAAHARWVSAATEPIAEWARGYARQVSVVPMAIDPAEYPAVAARESRTLVLGWAGTPGGVRYLESLGEVLRDLAERHDIVVRVISGHRRQVCVPGVPVEWRAFRAHAVIADISTFDVGLVPLHDSPFERAKFPFKLLQYMALGVPAVCARVGVARTLIESGVNGLLAGSPAEWRDALERCIGDVELRRKLGSNGRDSVLASYTIEKVGPRLVEAIRGAAG